ncbi:MAG: hypothetical protein ACYS22_21980, partial [Planctomycetota bacterium]
KKDDLFSRQEVIFLITPRIIDPDAASHDALRRLETFERARESFRHELSLLMRHVRTDRYLSLARSNVQVGDNDDALFWNGCAIRATPLHTSAWDMRYRLLGTEEIRKDLGIIERVYEKEAAMKKRSAPRPRPATPKRSAAPKRSGGKK